MKSATVTKVAITMMKLVMRTCFEITFRSEETSRLEPTSTKVVAAPMARPLMAELVTASAGHSPSSWTKTGFSFQNPFAASSLADRAVGHHSPLPPAPAAPAHRPAPAGARSSVRSPR